MRILVYSPALHSRLTIAQSKALEFLQKRALNIIFSSGEYATNLIIANVETLSDDDNSYHSFSSDGHEFGGHGPLAPSGSANALV